MDAQSFPRPLKFLDENDALLAHFYALVGSTGPLASAWLLALNQMAAAYPGLARHLPLGSPHPTTQRGVVFLGSSLNVLRVKPMDYLIALLQKHAPDLVRVCGTYLLYNLENCMLRDVRQHLGFPPEPPIQWRGEFLTKDNPIWIGPHLPEPTIIAGGTIPAGNITVIPQEATTKHVMQVRQYTNAFRPVKRPGPRPKPPRAPRAHRPTASDDEARRAWELAQQGDDRATIAKALFPDSPTGTEQERRRVLVKVDRRIARGRRLASPPPQR